MKMKQKPLSTGKIAKYCHVTHVAVCNWINNNLLEAYRTPGGQFRVRPHDFLKFLREHNMPTPPELQDEARYRILIIDDESHVVEIIVKVLQRKFPELDFMTANDGFTAGRLVEQQIPNMIILDFSMPGLDGLDMCRQISKDPQLKDTRILALTSLYNEESVATIIGSGADSVQKKPLDFDQMIDEVRRMLGIPGE